MYFCGMINIFEATVPLGEEMVKFTFNPINAYKLQLFQVYTMIKEQNVRFHMQINEEGAFEITDKERLPAAYLALEPQLANAIITNCS